MDGVREAGCGGGGGGGGRSVKPEGKNITSDAPEVCECVRRG